MKIIKNGQDRHPTATDALRQTVAGIIETVRREGDDALAEYSAKFDGTSRSRWRVNGDEIKKAYDEVAPADVDDMRQAADNIRLFAEKQRQTLHDLPRFEVQPGVFLGHRVLAVDSCACYVPGGGYPLYSSALMLAIPAKVAGVKRVVATSPVVKNSASIHPKTLVAMDLAGVDEIYALGGAQAVAALAYGTEQIPAVDVITGPGNQYVTEAKRQCYGQIGVDFIAGPSEVLVVADESGNADLIAMDLLAQCEHDTEAQSVLITTDEALAHHVVKRVEHHLQTLPTAEIARQSWQKYGKVLVAKSLDDALNGANAIAPEHLELHLKDAESHLDKLRHYGSVFIGSNTAEVFGDYASGTNHTLPTMGAARYTGGVWVGSYLKVVTHQQMSHGASQKMAPLVVRLAHGEGLIAHEQAAKLREADGKK